MENLKKLKISVVIPCYNEEKRIKNTLLSVIDFFNQEKKLEGEIIIVDDGSKDQTVELVKRIDSKIIIISHPRNLGKGAAVRTGIMSASGEYILFMDADNSTRISELEKFLYPTQKKTILIGSRYLKESYIGRRQSLLRFFLSRIANLIIRMILLQNIKDTQCGFKFFERKVAQELFTKQTLCNGNFDIEILALAQFFGYKIKEVPIEWNHYSKPKKTYYKDGLLFLKQLLIIKRNFILKKYHK